MEEKKYTVLVVDDSGLVLRNIKDTLQSKYEVKVAVSGKIALRSIWDCKPDVVLLDYEMPDMNGDETFDEIRKIPGAEEIPIIFLTSVDDKDTIVRLLCKKPFGYLLKPASATKLLQTIGKALGSDAEE